MTDHKAITDAELHEVKGAAGAASGTVPVSNGAGAAPFGVAPHRYAIEVTIPDISTASTQYIGIPYAGDILKITTAIDGTIATADADITAKINTVAVTDGVVTVAFSGSAAGDIDTATPTAANAVVEGDLLTIETDGASTNAVTCNVTVMIEVT